MPRRYISIEEQNAIIERAQGRCEYCQSWMSYATQSFVFEHITPLSHDGQTTLENLALACGGCNGHKYNKVEEPDPVDGKLFPYTTQGRTSGRTTSNGMRTIRGLWV